jgi:hypothetical protein
MIERAAVTGRNDNASDHLEGFGNDGIPVSSEVLKGSRR